MNVSEKEARELLKAMGFEAVKDWKRSKVQDKLNALQELLPESKEVEGDELTTQKRVISALEEGTKITVGADAETNGHASGKNGHAAGKNGTTKASKKTKGEKGGKDKKVATKAKVDRDRFGSRLDSMAAAINAKVAGKAKTAEVIAEESGVALNRVKGHLKYLEAKGFAVKSDKGFAVAKK